MDKQLKFSLEGYKKIDELEQLSSKFIIELLYLGLIAFFAFGFVFFALYALLTGKDGFKFNRDDAFLLVLVFVAIMIFHELVHGVFISNYGGKPGYGFRFPYLFVKTGTIFERNQRIVIYLAPLVVISIVGVVLIMAFPSNAHWLLIPLVANTSGAVGDLWMVRNLLRYPKRVLLEDQKDRIIIYGKETVKPLNLSAKNFIANFSKGFAVALFIQAILFNLLSVALPLLGVDSFTIGQKDSPFTIFEYTGADSEELYSVRLIFPPILSVSGIAGLAYSIIKRGKPQKKD